MRIRTLGARAAWPGPAEPCSSFLVETAATKVLLDVGYAALPAVLEHLDPRELDAVYVSHAHPDHCGDLAALLRARVLPDRAAAPTPLQIHALPGAVDTVLALDEPETLDGSYEILDLEPGTAFTLAGLAARSVVLPHFVPNAAVRITNGTTTLTYTGDCHLADHGPRNDLVELARGSDLLIAEATFPIQVPDTQAEGLSTAEVAGVVATMAGVRRLLLTHLWPGSDPAESLAAARSTYDGPIAVAQPGLVIDLTGADS